MNLELREWCDLALRWFHVFTAILWIGSTAFFTWLDARMRLEKDPATGKEEVWMVHSGGFYRVEKLGQPSLSHPLHWWKWEAFYTWLSGFLLLGLVYYSSSGLMLKDASDPSASPSLGLARAIGLASLFLGWTVYDVLWISPLARRPALGAAISLALLVGTCYGLDQVMSARAAYYHVGAIMGTIMTANVWMRIIPGQRKMVQAVVAGRAPDLTYGERAKMRSKHNTFMVVPLVLIMLSNHFGAATGGYSPARLVLFLAIGFAARKMLNLHDASKSAGQRLAPPAA